MTDHQGATSNGTSNNHDEETIVAMPTSALESKLRMLREKSNEHSQILTQKLASSQSGQNLLHIGTSLSSLPPDLHSLLTQLHPVLSAAESTEHQQLQKLQTLVQHANEIRSEQRRTAHAADCAELYLDLLAAERDVKRDATLRRNASSKSSSGVSFAAVEAQEEEEAGNAGAITNGLGGVLGEKQYLSLWVEPEISCLTGWTQCIMPSNSNWMLCCYLTTLTLLLNLLIVFFVDELDHVMSLERAAHTTLCLVQDLQSSNAQVTAMTTAKASGNNTAEASGTSASSLPSLRTPLEDDTERAQLLLKLAPRIRRLESDSIMSLSHRMEDVLNRLRQVREQEEDEDGGPSSEAAGEERSEAEFLLMLGHAMRGLALLGRGKEVESVFARVAIM